VVGGVGAPGRDADALDGVGVHLGQGHKAARFKQVMDGAAVPGLKGQGVAVPAIKGVASGADLGDAAAQGVVVTALTQHQVHQIFLGDLQGLVPSLPNNGLFFRLFGWDGNP
jgi:hypothetical protein